MIGKYQSEQEKLQGEIAVLESTRKDEKEQKKSIIKWADLMAVYVGIQELTAENLNLLVDMIEVFDRTSIGEEVSQTMKVYYRFDGYIPENCFSCKILHHPKKKRECA